MPARKAAQQEQETADENSTHARILEAASSAFVELGYARTSMLEIATRASVSKRDVYALGGTKQELLVGCIEQRAKRLQLPAELPEAHDRAALEQTLAAVGTQLLREVTEPTVIAMFRLAIAEAVHAPEVAHALEASGRATARAALTTVMRQAQRAGLVAGNPTEMVEQFAGLLWGDLLMSLLLRVIERPNTRELTRRARSAAAGLLRLYRDG